MKIEDVLVPVEIREKKQPLPVAQPRSGKRVSKVERAQRLLEDSSPSYTPVIAVHLTPRDERAIEHFFRGMSKLDAFSAVYPEVVQGVSSPSQLSKQVQRFFSRQQVVEEVDRRRQEARERNGATIDDMVTTMAKAIRVDMREYFDEDGCVKLPQDLTEEQGIFLSEYNRAKGSVKTLDKIATMQMLAKYLGMFQEKPLGLHDSVQINLHIGDRPMTLAPVYAAPPEPVEREVIEVQVTEQKGFDDDW